MERKDNKLAKSKESPESEGGADGSGRVQYEEVKDDEAQEGQIIKSALAKGKSHIKMPSLAEC